MIESLKVLEQALEAANKAGVFSLQGSVTVANAFANVVNALSPKQDKEEVVSTKKGNK